MHQHHLVFSSDKAAPYVYKLTNTHTGQVYIGSRWANNKPSSSDIFEYKSSSKVVNPRFDEFDVQILAEFIDKDSAYDFEQRCIHEMWGNPLLLNASCFYNGKRFRNVGGYTLSEGTKKKMQKPKSSGAIENMKISRRNRTDVHMGWKWTDEAKARGSEAQLGRIVTPEHRAKISKTNKEKGISPPKIMCSCTTCHSEFGTNVLWKHKCK